MYGTAAYAQVGFAEEGLIGNPRQDVQNLATEALVELFVLDATSLGGTVTRFHAGTNQLKVNVVFNGQTYSALPIEVTGFEYNGRGRLPRPLMKISNVDGVIGALVDTYDDLIGAALTRKRTFVKYLDPVNFTTGVNPTADPTAVFPDDVYYVDRKSSHTKSVVELELASSFDIAGVMLPRRTIVGRVCLWVYRSSECSYVGGPVADANDDPTASAPLDVCGKRVDSCKLRFGDNGVLPFGGFPGVGIAR